MHTFKKLWKKEISLCGKREDESDADCLVPMK